MRTLFFTLMLLPAAAGATQPQRLSPRGVRELNGIIEAARLDSLRWPEFIDSRTEIAEFYRSADYALTWVQDSKPTPKARAVIKLLQAADNAGLPAKDYDGPLWKDRLAVLDRPGRRAETHTLRFDLALTVCAMRYILDLHLGRINPRRFHTAFDLRPDVRGPLDFLRQQVVPAQDVSAVLRSVEPPFPAYRRLVKAVQRYQALADQDDGELLPESGTPVKAGDRYAGVDRLARLLRLLGDLPAQADHTPGRYSGALVRAVKSFQRRHGLTPDGILNEETLLQLNTPLESRLSQLRLTLERWRWQPHYFTRPPIIVNIPEFRLYAGDGPPQRVVVGIAFEFETPVFASKITDVVFRPAWNVPRSIQRDELVPKLLEDPLYLERHSYEVLDGEVALSTSGALGPETLSRLQEGRLTLRQRPGPNNALGLVKFHMPNTHSVYLHGTPSRHGFREARRDFSHSCIRVEHPEALAAWALRDQPEWTPERIAAAMAGEETVTVKLTEPIQVLIQYGTAAVSENDEVRFFDDIYSRDAAEGAAFEERARVVR